MGSMSRSTLTVAKDALTIARGALPRYTSQFSKPRFTAHQLFAILVVRQFLKLDLRGMEQLLREWSDLRRVLGLRETPHYSTLCVAQRRLFKGGPSPA